MNIIIFPSLFYLANQLKSCGREVKMVDYSFKSASYSSRVLEAFSSSLNNSILADVTLVCDGDVYIKAHKFILGMVSPVLMRYFSNSPNNSSIFLFGTSYNVLNAILGFIYTGETSLKESDIKEFLVVAEKLEIDGITRDSNLDLKPDQNKEKKSESKSNAVAEKSESGKNDAVEKLEIDGTTRDSNLDPLELETEMNIQKSGQLPFEQKSDEQNDMKSNFLMEIGLKHHMETKDKAIKKEPKLVSNNEKFKCQSCSKSFSFRSTLRNHSMIKHSIEL